jgi:hypothetical protein
VIDGLQRLSAINDYMDVKFSLCGLQYLQDECGGLTFEKLNQKYQTRIEDTQLTVNIIAPQSPTSVKFDIFRRVNTGGVPLNAQEIRNILETENTRKYLLQMAQCQEFLSATRERVNDIRMDAQELCLRFIAFYTRYNPTTHELSGLDSMTNMLDSTVERLNKMQPLEFEKIFETFRNSMLKCRALFGATAFSKPHNEHIINKVLFTSWAVVLSSYDIEIPWLEANQQIAIKKLYNMLDQDADYFTSISSSTGTKTNIKKQFDTAYQIMEELIHA